MISNESAAMRSDNGNNLTGHIVYPGAPETPLAEWLTGKDGGAQGHAYLRHERILGESSHML